jgi:hypothetical protein
MGGWARGRANTAAIFVSAYLRHYFRSIFLPILLTMVVKFKFGQTHIRVIPDNGVGAIRSVKIDGRRVLIPEIIFVSA